MAVTLIGTQGLFTRLGVVNRLANTLDGARSNAAPNTGGEKWGSSGPQIFDLYDAIQNIFAQFTTNDIDVSSALAQVRSSVQSGIGGAQQQLVQLANSILTSMVQDDAIANPGTQFPVYDGTMATALAIIINQMIGTGTIQAPQYYIVQPTISVTVGSITTKNSSTWKVAFSTTNRNGIQSDYCANETLTVTCTSDQNSGLTAGSETLAVQSSSPVNPNDFVTAPPSGANASLTMVNPVVTSQNLLTNSDFQNFTVTANLPDGWLALSGTVGTTIKEGALPYYSQAGDTACLQFASDGTTQISIAQTFGTGTNGNGVTLNTNVTGSNNVYAVGFWVKQSGTSAAAGTLTVDLIDSAGSPAVVTDDAGNSNSVALAYTSITTSYALTTAFFRIPKSLSSYTLPLRIRVRESTAFTSGTNVNVTGMFMSQATQIYAGGPYAVAVRGNVDAEAGDYYKPAVANNWDSAAFWAKMLQKIFNLRAQGLIVPSSTNSPAYVLENLTN